MSQPVTNLVPPTLGPFAHKLTATNYYHWKAQMEPMLWGQGLIQHVDGSIDPPSPTNPSLVEGGAPTPNPEYPKWRQEDQRVLSWIMWSVSDSILPQVIGSTSAREAWQRLARVYASGSRVQIRHLRFALDSLKKGNDSVDVYLNRAKAIIDQLTAMGAPVNEDEVVDKILIGLDESFRPFARTIEAKSEPVQLADLHALLLNEELNLRRAAELSALSLVPSANFTKTSGGRGGNNHRRGRGGYGGRSGGRPNWRGSEGGPSSYNNGPARSNGSGYFPPPQDNEVRCYNCGGYGHVSKSCSSVKRGGQQRTGPPQAHTAVSPQGSQWILDSGTTHHLTSDLQNLPIHSEYSGTEEVTFGSGYEDNTPPRPE